MRATRPLTRWRLVVFSLVPAVALLLVAELGARVYYYYRTGEVRHLITPLREAQPNYRYRWGQTYTNVDQCSGRALVYTINRAGGRGPEWTAKAAGRVRLMALGESSTFGVANPDGETWPALLADNLRRRAGEDVEVLNAGRPSIRLEAILELLPQMVVPHAPDVALYYGGFNDTIDAWIERFQRATWLGRLTAWLHYRSMLSTYAVEKTYFSRVKRLLVPPVRPFEDDLRRLVRTLRERRVTPVIVLQATQLPRDPSIRTLDLTDRAAVEAAIRRLAESAPTGYDAVSRLRVYQTQVLQEAARRLAAAERVHVIDPRARIEAGQRREPLFCDAIHLTDAGNGVLAEAIAEGLPRSLLDSARR
jgi:lysophospholipase L1-like esterase